MVSVLFRSRNLVLLVFVVGRVFEFGFDLLFELLLFELLLEELEGVMV